MSQGTVYFIDSAGDGDFYECISAADVGDSPELAPAKWQKREIPMIFRDALVEKATSILLMNEGQEDKALALDAKAESRVAQLMQDSVPLRSARTVRPKVVSY